MLKRLMILAVLLGVSEVSAFADAVTYLVSVNTSSISGTSGSLDFQFNPGPLTVQGAVAQISAFNSNGTLAGSPVLTGDASGSLPGTVTLDNGSGFNDYFEGFKYGSTLSFEVNLSGLALTSPNNSALSGSAFTFSMFSDPGGTMPTLTTDSVNGYGVTIDVNLHGTTTPTVFSREASVAAVPEPSSFVLLGIGSGLAFWKFRLYRSNG